MKNKIDEDLKILGSTQNVVVRNSLALRFAEAGEIRALPIILELIKTDELEGCRATLVHCLSFYNPPDHFELLIELLVNGNWEVAHEAHEILISIEEVSGENVDKAYEMLSGYISCDTAQKWRNSLLKNIISLFE